MKDPYLIPGTDVLRNKLGFTDHERLDRATHDIAESAALKLFAARRRIPSTMPGWQAVHRAMFTAIFDWAGQFRTIHLRKAKNLTATLRHIPSGTIERIAENLADVYAQMNEVHPFREGNGRSQKVFFSLVCRPYNLQLRWDKIDPAEHNVAARAASANEFSLMRRHFRAMVSPLPEGQVALYLPRR